MIVEQGWLEEFVNLNGWSAETVATVLTDLGLEVEHVQNPAHVFHRFVVGKVVTCEKHPKADKLSVCTVDVGESDVRTIVCGAPNVAGGQMVIAALDGAMVPNGGYTIEKRTLRGVESNGMLCSKAELQLADEADGIMILDTDALPGTPAHTVLQLNTVYDVAVTPNRADCLSHIGIARDLAAYQQVHGGQRGESVRVTTPTPPATATTETQSPAIPATVADPSLAPVYAVQRITGIANGPSPQWMQQRLQAVGLRPRNLIIDVTNYVNMECGQPLHAFDTSKLAGPSINVRAAKNDADFVTLDGKTRSLTNGMLLICDSEKPVAIAGVMGGANSEIDETTTDVCIEAAWFNQQSVRRTARLLGLSTDASYRFERGVDPGGVFIALSRATSLLVELGGGTTQGCTVAQHNVPTPPTITVRYQRMRDIVGCDIDNPTIAAMLTAIGCSTISTTDESCTIMPPSWRMDITEEIDLAEEVMRLHGVNAIPEKHTATTFLDGSRLAADLQVGGGRTGQQRRSSMLDILRSRGYASVVGHVLTAPSQHDETANHQITLKNALGLEFSALRTSLIPGILDVVAHNINHGATTIRLAEFGNVFQHNNESDLGVQQHEHLTLAVCGSTEEQWNAKPHPLDYYDVLNDIEAAVARPLQCTPIASPAFLWTNSRATLSIGDVEIGTVGIISPERTQAHGIERTVCVAQINLDVLDSLPEHKPTYEPISPFPTMRRDIALVVEENITAADIHFLVRQVNPPAYLGAFVFDVFRDEQQIGAGRKSVGIALKFGASDRTLVDTDVEASVQAIISAAQQRLGATLRGNI